MQNFETTFDNATLEYDYIRPNYPNELYEDIFEYKAIDSSSNVLEIGIGSGKATEKILERGCNLIGIEPGKNLAKYSKEKFKRYSNFSMQNCMLQEFEGKSESFDFIYAATSFHWIPEAYGYKRVYDLLKKGGIFARFGYHAGRDRMREQLTKDIQKIYDKYMGKKSEYREYSEIDAKQLAEIGKKYGFIDTKYKMYHWTKDFSADDYMKLLKTYPDHMRLEESSRQKFFEEIYDIINCNGGIITVYYTMDLQLARKNR